jgi:hypothetical protein
VPMLLSGEQRLNHAQTGVLKLEVISSRNLAHGFRPSYIKIEYGRNLHSHEREHADVIFGSVYRSHEVRRNV